MICNASYYVGAFSLLVVMVYICSCSGYPPSLILPISTFSHFPYIFSLRRWPTSSASMFSYFPHTHILAFSLYLHSLISPTLSASGAGRRVRHQILRNLGQEKYEGGRGVHHHCARYHDPSAGARRQGGVCVCACVCVCVCVCLCVCACLCVCVKERERVKDIYFLCMHSICTLLKHRQIVGRAAPNRRQPVCVCNLCVCSFLLCSSLLVSSSL